MKSSLIRSLARYGLAMAVVLLVNPPANAQPAKFTVTDKAGVSHLAVNQELVAAMVNGQALFLKDLNDPRIYELRKQLFDMETALLRRQALERLLAAFPDRYKMPVVKVSDAEIASFYNLAGLGSRGSLKDFQAEIRDFLMEQKLQEVEAMIFKRAVEAGDIKSFLEPPPAYLFKLPKVARNAAKGLANAPVHLVEFSDFQCPFCQKVIPTVDALMKLYPNKIYLIYRHFPLDAIHPQAYLSAIASECAAEQGKFWAYHDLLFSNQQRQLQEHLVEYARRAEIPDMAAFSACLISNRYAELVEGDLQAGSLLGVEGTPTFFIGRNNNASGTLEGTLLVGAQPIEAFVTAIENLLPPN